MAPLSVACDGNTGISGFSGVPVMLRKFFKKSGSVETGASLDHAECWELPAPINQDRVANALGAILPEGSVLVLETTSIDPDVERSLRDYLVPAALNIRAGIIWPRSKMLHVGVTPESLRVLDDLITGLPAPQICSHLYAYVHGVLLLEWTDVFDDPIYISGTIPQASIARFCETLGVTVASTPHTV
jgi:hypothetical protein